MAVRNGAGTLQSALDSVFEQTYDRVELVVMDGASTDGTQAILERNGARIAYWRSEADTGVYQAWNRALDHVTGDWICFLGADDRFHAPDVLASIVTALAGEQGRRVAYGRLVMLRDDGSTQPLRGRPWGKAARKGFRRGEMIPHPATFHHRSVFEDNGRFDESFVIAGDYEFLLREVLDHAPLFIPVYVVDMSAGGLSHRPSTRSLVAREVYRARYMHGIASAPPWRSGRLFVELSRIWVGLHVTPRIAGLRARLVRTSGRRP
jgi:glycosyltransferase involved in cell wall biosynthesis